MSDLQLGLLAIGAVVVIAVLAYNKWQEARFRREAEGVLGSRHDDVLMGAAESSAGAPPAPPATAGVSAATPMEQRIDPTFEGPETRTVPVDPAAFEEPLLAESTDFIVTIEASEDIDGEALIDAAAAPLAGFSKPMRLEGFNEAAAKWELLQPGTRCTLMRAGLQLVDRQGRASEDELATFGAGVQQAAASAGVLATVPDRGDAIAHATELDAFCSQVDILIALHVVASAAPFAGTKVRALAEASGLVLEEDGRFRRRDDEGRALYEIANMDASPFRAEAMRSSSISGLTLELDVPRTPEPARAFEQFRDLARQLAQALDASVVDEKRLPVSPAAFDQIAGQIQSVQSAMAARSIHPGTPLALRLFS
jgi:hypothetical protein